MFGIFQVIVPHLLWPFLDSAYSVARSSQRFDIDHPKKFGDSHLLLHTVQVVEHI